jgi:hypothetical protein
MARNNKPAPKKPTIKIPPRQQNATVAVIHESDEPLEFPESPAPSPNNSKKLGRLLKADWSLFDYDGFDRVEVIPKTSSKLLSADLISFTTSQASFRRIFRVRPACVRLRDNAEVLMVI